MPDRSVPPPIPDEALAAAAPALYKQWGERLVEHGAKVLHDESGARPLKWEDRPEGAKDFWRAKMRRALGIGNAAGEALDGEETR